MPAPFQRGDYVAHKETERVYVVVRIETDGKVVCQDEDARQDTFAVAELEPYDWRTQAYPEA